MLSNWTRCDTNDNVCLDLHNCSYSIYICIKNELNSCQGVRVMVFNATFNNISVVVSGMNKQALTYNTPHRILISPQK